MDGPAPGSRPALNERETHKDMTIDKTSVKPQLMTKTAEASMRLSFHDTTAPNCTRGHESHPLTLEEGLLGRDFASKHYRGGFTQHKKMSRCHLPRVVYHQAYNVY